MPTTTHHYSITTTSELYGSEHSFPLIAINTDKCNAVISLYGGQVLTFKPANKPPLLWLSPSVIFKEGKAIRGGIPVCAPWFGNHPDFSLSHGFARISLWQQDSILELDNGDIVVELTLTENDLSKKHDYHQFTMRLKIILSDDLTIEFSFENDDDVSQTCEWAMHSYLQVDNCQETTVNGLVNCLYHDKTLNNQMKTLSVPQNFNTEVDRSFTNGSITQTIENTSPITITGQHCDSVIVWNPGKKLADTMPDISNYHQFVCVERGAIGTNRWNILPQSKQTATMTISN